MMPAAAQSPALVAAGRIVFASLAIVVVTPLAGRLLGVRRGWVQLLVAGISGWGAALVLGGVLSDWTWSSAEMVFTTAILGPVFTMVVAVGLDLVAPPSKVKRGAEAGLLRDGRL